MEELSAIHCVSKAMTSNDRLIKVLVNMIKSPDKVEVSMFATATISYICSSARSNSGSYILEEMHYVVASLVPNC